MYGIEADPLLASSELKKTAIYMDLFTVTGFSLAGIENAP